MRSKPAGRPVNKDRSAAIVLGDRTYAGKRCKKCGGTERYTKGCGCVTCLRSYAIESRQIFKAAKLTGFDFLDAAPVVEPSDFTHIERRVLAHMADENLDFLGDLDLGPDRTYTPTLSDSLFSDQNTQEGYSVDGKEKHTEHGVQLDPEPLCPDCGQGVTADHETIGGWLHRVSPWRCTICDWEDAEPPPSIPKLG